LTKQRTARPNDKRQFKLAILKLDVFNKITPMGVGIIYLKAIYVSRKTRYLYKS